MRHYPLLIASVALACADHTTAPPAVQIEPRLSAADAQPNVQRFTAEFVFGIADSKTGLIAFAGLPDNPRDVVECGGTVELHFVVAEHQWVGFRQDIIKAIAKANDANLDVYDLSTFTGVCGSDPIAHGTGRMAAHANDLFMTSDRAYLFGFSMQGTVTLATGGTAHLSADALEQISASGEFRQTVGNVTLSTP